MHEFDYIAPPSGVRTIEDVADYLENNVRRYLYAAGELNDIDGNVASGILMDVAEATECLATFLRTKSLPEMEDVREHDIDHLGPLLRKCVLVGDQDAGHAMHLIAETLEQLQTLKPVDETSDTVSEVADEPETPDDAATVAALPGTIREVAEQLRHELAGRFSIIGDFVNGGVNSGDEGFNGYVDSLAAQSANLCRALAVQLETGEFDPEDTDEFKTEDELEQMLVALCQKCAKSNGDTFDMKVIVDWLRDAREPEQAQA